MIGTYTNQIIEIERYLGPSPSGNRYSVRENLNARYESINEVVRRRDLTRASGKEFVANGLIIAAEAVTELDRLYIDGRPRKIEKVTSTPDLSGMPYIWEVYF